MNITTKEYWQNQYHEGKTGWDIGLISTPIKEYVDQLKDKTIKILIPGAGHAYEAEYLFELGFTKVFVLDIASKPLENFSTRFPGFPKSHLLQGDFFLHQGKYDLILEQTFFSALPPVLRPAYVDKMHELLKPNGKLVGLLFAIDFGNSFPPFGGNRDEYFFLFTPKFEIKTLEKAHNSIKPRAENEFFHIFIPKNI